MSPDTFGVLNVQEWFYPAGWRSFHAVIPDGAHTYEFHVGWELRGAHWSTLDATEWLRRQMRGDWPAFSYISKCNLEARGQSAEERAYIDRLTKVPHVLVGYLNSHLPCLGG